MPGSKTKATTSTMDTSMTDVPQLSNEMQMSIMLKVKNGEITIEEALEQARKDRETLLRQKNPSNNEQLSSQYNFSVHKHGRYRWQKRVLQLDFETKMLCSIEKGIIKRQLPFSAVKSCDDGVGSRFSISFKDHHDYELEATSLEDKHKLMQLVNQIIYGNIYSDSEGDNAEMHQQPQASRSLREGVLLLHRGGLASFRWVKYEVQLHPGQVTLVPFRQQGTTNGEVTSSAPMSVVIHLSDGDTRVQKPTNSDTFTLITHKNEYQFKVLEPDETAAPGAVQMERDAWVQAIDRLCSAWKRKSRGDHIFPETTCFEYPGTTEDTANNTDPQSSGRFDNANVIYPPADPKNADPVSSGDTSQSEPTTPIPKPRKKSEIRRSGPDVLKPTPVPNSPHAVAQTLPCPHPPSPSHTGFTPSPTGPCTPTRKAPPPPSIPAPPPLPFKPMTGGKKKHTKAFHWDVVGPDKIGKSFWKLESSKKIEINTTLLYEQFAVKDLGTSGVTEPSNTQQIMLNPKIAHNFNIFLKSFPVQPGELKDKLFVINEEDGGLSDEHITSLRRYVPTMDDVEMYKSHKGPVTELHVVDQYMIEMCNIPYLSTQLDLLVTLRELPVSMNDLQPLIKQKITMCTQLYNCRSFVCVLEYLLAIGNYLNENAGKDKAKGFRLSSLTKLSQLRGRDKKFTLLHALVEQIMLQESHLAIFTQELAEFETVPGASIKGLTAEVDVLKNELEKVVQYRKSFKKTKAGAHNPNFSEDLKIVIENYNQDFTALTKKCEEMKKLYSAILVKFGEPADQDSQEFFGVICQFLHGFKQVYAETG